MAKGKLKNEIKNKIIFNLANEFGGVQTLAKALDISLPNISHWMRTDLPVPLRHAIKIEIITNGRVKACELRPDVMKGYRLVSVANE